MPKRQTIEEFSKLLDAFLSDSPKTSETPARRKKALENKKLSRRIILEIQNNHIVEATLE